MLLQLLVTILNRIGEPEKKPWDKGNSELIKSSISDITFLPTYIHYAYGFCDKENINAGISDINIVITKI